MENKGIFYPIKQIELYPDSIGLPFKDIIFETKDGNKINGWFIPNEKAKYTVYFLHGNAGNIGHRLEKIKMLLDIGLNVFIIDYRGYGKSEGMPKEKGLYLDAVAGYNYLVKNLGINPDHIILFGESLGTAISVYLASNVKVKALILEGSFSCGRDFGKRLYPFIPSFLFSNTYDSIGRIKRIECPVLFIHSRFDDIIPIDMARKLYDNASEPKYFSELPDGNHNSAFMDSSKIFIESIAEFVNNLHG